MRMQARRSVSLLLAIVMVLSLCVCASAAGASTVSLTLAEPAVNQGTVRILLNAEKADTVADGKYELTYDPAALAFLNGEVGSAWPEGSDVSLKVNASQEGKLIVAFAGVYEAGQGDVVVLNFLAAAEGETTVTLNGTEELAVDVACPSAKFVDVVTTKWYHEAVDFAVANGYMTGVDATHFVPTGKMTRAQMVVVLYRLAGEPDMTGVESPFTDAPKWAKDACTWAAAEGITNGTSATTFTPNRELTREETATFMYRYAEKAGVSVDARADLSTFQDADKVGKWFANEMSWAVAVGLMKGTGSGNLSPKGVTDRATVAQLLMNFNQNVLG